MRHIQVPLLCHAEGTTSDAEASIRHAERDINSAEDVICSAEATLSDAERAESDAESAISHAEHGMNNAGGFKPPSGTNRRLPDAPLIGIVRLKDACTFLPGVYNTRTTH